MQIVSTCIVRDLPVYRITFESLRTHLPDAEVHVIIRKEDFKKFRNACGDELIMWDEAKMIPTMSLLELSKLPLPFFPEGAGWYFQQFLKFSFVNVSNNDTHFLIWDADTILLRPLDFFDESGRPIYTRAEEYNHPYFETFLALLGIVPKREFSFISQHQIIDKKILRQLLAEVESRNGGKSWPWAIMGNLKGIGTNLFSEYETYGHYVKYHNPESFVVRDISWTREGGGLLCLPPWKLVLRRLARQHSFAAFEASNGIARKLLRIYHTYKSLYIERKKAN